MSEFLSIQRFEDHIENHKDLEKRVNKIDKELSGKVSWIVFWSIVSLLVIIVGGMWALLYAEIKELRSVSVGTATEVTYIKGVLDNAQITK